MPEPNPYKKSPLGIDKADVMAFLLCGGIFFVWINILLDKFIYFGYYDWDLAIYANAMWALTHGSFSGSLWGTNFLTNHAEYISFLLIPIYAVFPSAFTLVTLKLLSVIGGGFVLYRIAKHLIGWQLALGLMVLYFAFPANFFMLIFEFHFESLAIVFIFLVYYYLRIRTDYRKFIICCILASICKENIPLMIFMFGFMSLFQKNVPGRKFAWTAMGIGAGIFVLDMFLIMPLLRHWEGMATIASPYIGLYWGEASQQSARTNIAQLFLRLTDSQSISYLKDLFLPLLFIPLLGFKTLLIALPLFLQALLSSSKQMQTVYYHYAATLSPILFLATLEALSWSRRRWNKILPILLFSLITAGIIINWNFHADRFYHSVQRWKDNDDKTRIALKSQIPPDASVISTFDFLNQLANRDHIYPLRNVWLGYNPFHSQSSYLVPQVSYALVDLGCPWLWDESMTPQRDETRKRLNRLKDFYFNQNWNVQGAGGEIVLLKKIPAGSSPKKSLVELQKKTFAFEKAKHGSIDIDHNFQLLSSEMKRDFFTNSKEPLTALTFYWKADRPINDLYIVDVILVRTGKEVVTARHHIGYAVYPTPLWENNDYIKETYWIDTSALPEGEYSVSITVGNLTTDRWAKMVHQTKLLRQISFGSFTIRQVEGDVPYEK